MTRRPSLWDLVVLPGLTLTGWGLYLVAPFLAAIFAGLVVLAVGIMGAVRWAS